MDRIKKLKGLVYPDDDVSDRVAPPFDVISPEKARELSLRHPHNVRRLILPLKGEGEGWQKRVAQDLEDWLSKGILHQLPDSLFLSEQRFDSYTRRAVLAGLRLEKPGNGIYPHEHTMPGVREERYILLREARAQFSPIFLIARDDGKLLDALLSSKARTISTATDDEGTVHQLKVLEESETIISFLEEAELYIADGHHRYLSALRLAEEGGPKYAFSAIVPSSDTGLIIKPYHRIFDGFFVDVKRLSEELEKLFEFDTPRVQPGRIVFVSGEFETGLCPKEEARALLKDTPELLAHLDVTVADKLLRPLLEWVARRDLTLRYTHSEEEARRHTSALLAPVPLKVLMEAGKSGLLLPPKSTYFYPKFLSGLPTARAVS